MPLHIFHPVSTTAVVISHLSLSLPLYLKILCAGEGYLHNWYKQHPSVFPEPLSKWEYHNHCFSGVFTATTQERGPQVILNADGIYLTTYSVLSLNLQLIRGGNYCDPDLPLSITQVSLSDRICTQAVLIVPFC